MIQPTPPSRPAALFQPAFAPARDPAAFGLSQATPLDTPRQVPAMHGKRLPPPAAPVSWIDSGPDVLYADVVRPPARPIKADDPDRRPSRPPAAADTGDAAAAPGKAERATRRANAPPPVEDETSDDMPAAGPAPAATALAPVPLGTSPATIATLADAPAAGADQPGSKPVDLVATTSDPTATAGQCLVQTKRGLETVPDPSTAPSTTIPGDLSAASAQGEAVPDRPKAANPAPVALPPTTKAPAIVAGAAAPAFRLFAQALHAARRDEVAGDPLAPATAVEPMRVALPVNAANGAPLDMSDHRWPHAMVDRIEALRDAASAAADAADTSIRLVPASLGRIDVSVRRDGDTVHVHFAAEQAATRTLLTDAQPRLAELAESRGLRLGQASVGAGAEQQGQRQPAPNPARMASAPVPAASGKDPELATTRVA